MEQRLSRECLHFVNPLLKILCPSYWKKKYFQLFQQFAKKLVSKIDLLWWSDDVSRPPCLGVCKDDFWSAVVAGEILLEAGLRASSWVDPSSCWLGVTFGQWAAGGGAGPRPSCGFWPTLNNTGFSRRCGLEFKTKIKTTGAELIISPVFNCDAD